MQYIFTILHDDDKVTAPAISGEFGTFAAARGFAAERLIGLAAHALLSGTQPTLSGISISDSGGRHIGIEFVDALVATLLRPR